MFLSATERHIKSPMSFFLFYRIFWPAVGLRTGAGTIWRTHANSKLSVLTQSIAFHSAVKNPNLVFVWSVSTEHIFAKFDSDDEHELKWSDASFDSEALD